MEDRWNLALVGSLQSPHDLSCSEINTEKFEINQSGRYIKVTLDSSYRTHGTALQYIDVTFKKPCSGNNKGLKECKVLVKLICTFFAYHLLIHHCRDKGRVGIMKLTIFFSI